MNLQRSTSTTHKTRIDSPVDGKRNQEIYELHVFVDLLLPFHLSFSQMCATSNENSMSSECADYVYFLCLSLHLSSSFDVVFGCFKKKYELWVYSSERTRHEHFNNSFCNFASIEAGFDF